jgi:FkbM family methyltransferase
MSEQFDRNDSATGKSRQRPSVRWDRLLSKEMTSIQSSQSSSTSETISQKVKDIGMPMKRRGSRILVKLLKRPALRIRDFLIAPIAERIDQTRLSQEYLINQNRLVQEKAAEAHQREMMTLLGNLADNILEMQRNVGFLHTKADEQARKTWPIIHLQDAYAVPLADGYIFIPDADEGILLMYARATSEGLEPGARRVLKAILQPGDFAIDVGASLGMHTIAMANAIGYTGHVDAFEAEPRLTAILNRTLAVNGMHHVSLHACAAGAKDGTASFNVAQTIGHSSLYDLGSDNLVRDKVTVPMKTLDSAIAPNIDIKLIKIDVEGAELDVIRGARRILTQSTDCAIVAECGPSHLRRVHVSLADWIGEFTSLGYEAYTIKEPSGDIAALNMEWLAEQESVNVAFLKKGGALSRRLMIELGST